MSVKEMKETLIKRIQESDDETYLEILLEQSHPLRDESAAAVYKLSDAQRAAVLNAREQVASGEYFTHEEVMREWKDWNSSANEEWTDK